MKEHVYHQSELRKLTNKVGFLSAYQELMLKWNHAFSKYFNK